MHTHAHTNTATYTKPPTTPQSSESDGDLEFKTAEARRAQDRNRKRRARAMERYINSPGPYDGADLGMFSRSEIGRMLIRALNREQQSMTNSRLSVARALMESEWQEKKRKMIEQAPCSTTQIIL